MTRNQRRQADYFDMMETSQSKIQTRHRTTRVSSKVPVGEVMQNQDLGTTDLLYEDSIDSGK